MKFKVDLKYFKTFSSVIKGEGAFKTFEVGGKVNENIHNMSSL